MITDVFSCVLERYRFLNNDTEIANAKAQPNDVMEVKKTQDGRQAVVVTDMGQTAISLMAADVMDFKRTVVQVGDKFYEAVSFTTEKGKPHTLLMPFANFLVVYENRNESTNDGIIAVHDAVMVEVFSDVDDILKKPITAQSKKATKKATKNHLEVVN